MMIATFLPLLFIADFNEGVSKLGCVNNTMNEEFKAKPDYATGKIFMGHRKSVPEFKYF